MKDYQEYNNKLFSRWAPIYDGFEIVLAGVRKKVVHKIDPINQSVLDVATGTGSLAIALRAEAKKVVGIDLSSKMLDVARRKGNYDNLSFLQMDASKMSFQDDEFDIVTISLGLHDMPLQIRSSVLEEVKRVLKKDGRLYILEHNQLSNRFYNRCSVNLMNIFESKYYLEFIKSDILEYLNSFDFKLDKKTSYLLGHLQFLELTN